MVKRFAKQSEYGYFHIPLAAVLVVVCIAGGGLWRVMAKWSDMVSLQLRLNQCVGEKANEFRDRVNRIESHNVKIQVARLAVVAGTATFNPAAVNAAKIAIQGFALAQDYEQVAWEMSRAKWIALRGCGEKLSLASLKNFFPAPLPELSYSARQTDSIGPMPLRWSGAAPDSFHIQLVHLPRAAAATIKGGSLGSILPTRSDWETEWTIPNKH